MGDHKMSLNPNELKRMIKYVRIADSAKSKIVFKRSKKN